VTVTQLEPFVDIEELASHLHMSRRWVEYRIKDGMPRKMFGSAPRFQVSECLDWLVKEGHVKEENG
jgi:hypothetical protein